MLRQGFVLALGAGLLIGMVGHADAAKRTAKAPPGAIILQGCAAFQPPFCTILTSRGSRYSLVEAAPPVPQHVGVTVIGVKIGDVGPCFAPTIRVLRWSRNRMRCPL